MSLVFVKVINVGDSLYDKEFRVTKKGNNTKKDTTKIKYKTKVPDSMAKEYKSKTKYTVIVRELSDGDVIETDGIIEGLTTVILKDGKLKVGGVVRHTRGEIY
jgi:hypothetical protein